MKLSILKLLVAPLLFVSLVACDSKVNEGTEAEKDPIAGEKKIDCVGLACAACDLPWGGQLAAGETMEAGYAKELLECTQSCADFKTKLSCAEGKLSAQLISSGTPIAVSNLTLFSACHEKRCDCLHAGVSIPQDTDVKFFRSAQVACPATGCTDSRLLTCKKGVVVDKLVPSNKTFVDNYKAPTCSVVPCTNCALPSGDSILHGQYTWVHSTPTVGCGQSCTSSRAYLYCNNGVVTNGDKNTYQHVSCAPRTACQTCTLPCGKTIFPGGSDFCYKSVKPAACGLSCINERKLFKCSDTSVLLNEDNSAVSAATKAEYAVGSCSEGAACVGCDVPGGASIKDGEKAAFYKKNIVNCDESCLTSDNQVMLTCSNGKFSNQLLYPDFKYGSCSSNCSGTAEGDKNQGRIVGLGGGAPNTVCSLPWKSGVVTHDTKVTAFSRKSVACGEKCSAYKMTITCNGYRGLWSGGGVFIHPTCVEQKCN